MNDNVVTGPKIVNENEDYTGVDTDLYSRAQLVLGAGNIKKLQGLNVLVSGMLGLGVETAKNLILCGCGNVTVHDTETVALADLSAQFYLSPKDVGKNRAEASLPSLVQLNEYSSVKAITDPLTTELLANYQAVVLTNNKSLKKLKELGDFCHNHDPAIIFIVADVRGLFASVFADFGPKHIVYDATGEENVQAIVTSISNSTKALVTTIDDKPHGLGTGDYVQFSEVQGMTDINWHEGLKDSSPVAAIRVSAVNGKFGLELELDTTNFPPYKGQGLIKQVKTETLIQSQSFAQSAETPGELIISDFAKFDRAGQLHFGYLALLTFCDRHDGQLPEFSNQEHAEELLSIAQELNDAAKAKNKNEEANQPEEAKRVKFHSVDALDEKVIKQIALQARGDLNPMSAFIGGVVAQEVLKITGKFGPIHQWFHFDSLEALPDKVEDNQPMGRSRYDAQIGVFGRQFQEKLSNLKLFLVGAGALGCEFLKNFAMMGIATGPEGILHLTDMDNIEKSNLSRQFLFRNGDIGKMKSACASTAAKKMNPDIKIKASEIPVGLETEDTWNVDFWKGLDLVVNALDNLKARLYVDSLCVAHLLPLLESGTLGTKANTQVILPRMTESYGSSRDPPEPSIPMCTLRNYPHLIEHTIEWARDRFHGYFNNAFHDANNWIVGDGFVQQVSLLERTADKRDKLEAVVSILELSQGITFEKCVEWARLQFEQLFHNIIAQLLFNFPLDAKATNGQPFWSGSKRAPKPLKFDSANSHHLDFIIAAANLLAYSFRIPADQVTADREKIAEMLRGVKVPDWQPKSGIKIKAEETDSTVEGSDEDEDQVKRLLGVLSKTDRKSFKVDDKGNAFTPAHFEKDDDNNFHIAFMTAASNLRALNYGIGLADFQKTKAIAGRIIPAIATTTAMITGLVCLELYKVIQKGLPLERFRNSFVNLALPNFVQSEPSACQVHKSKEGVRCYPDGFTLWDPFIVDEGDLTIGEFVECFEKKHKLAVLCISCGKSAVYYPAFFPHHRERLPLKISEYVKNNVEGYVLQPTDKEIALVVLAKDAVTQEDVELPEIVHFKFRK